MSLLASCGTHSMNFPSFSPTGVQADGVFLWGGGFQNPHTCQQVGWEKLVWGLKGLNVCCPCVHSFIHSPNSY